MFGRDNGLADCLGISRVVLVRLHVGFDKLRCHQPYRMPKSRQLACPVMGTAAGLHTNEADRQVGKQFSDLAALQLLLQRRLAALIDRVNLKHVLCQVDTNCRNLHGGRPYRFKWLLDTSTLAH
jgi:hypothetical protein